MDAVNARETNRIMEEAIENTERSIRYIKDWPLMAEEYYL
jgi:hypothetical protein